MATDRVRESIVIKADVDAIYEVIGDFESYPEWQEEFRTAEILETNEDGWGTKVHYTLSAMGISAHLTLEYTYEDTKMSWQLVESDKLQRLDGAYTMDDLGDGTTEMTYELEVESTIPLPSMVRKQLAKKIVRQGLDGVKARVES